MVGEPRVVSAGATVRITVYESNGRIGWHACTAHVTSDDRNAVDPTAGSSFPCLCNHSKRIISKSASSAPRKAVCHVGNSVANPFGSSDAT